MNDTDPAEGLAFGGILLFFPFIIDFWGNLFYNGTI